MENNKVPAFSLAYATRFNVGDKVEARDKRTQKWRTGIVMTIIGVWVIYTTPNGTIMNNEEYPLGIPGDQNPESLMYGVVFSGDGIAQEVAVPANLVREYKNPNGGI